jgi:hypothetical protein
MLINLTLVNKNEIVNENGKGARRQGGKKLLAILPLSESRNAPFLCISVQFTKVKLRQDYFSLVAFFCFFRRFWRCLIWVRLLASPLLLRAILSPPGSVLVISNKGGGLKGYEIGNSEFKKQFRNSLSADMQRIPNLCPFAPLPFCYFTL